MSNTVQIKARKAVVQFYNDRPAEGPHKRPVNLDDVRILFWRSVISENTWMAVLWIRYPEPTFYLVKHDKTTKETIVHGYFIAEYKIMEEGTI